jgi:hypothetical protein
MTCTNCERRLALCRTLGIEAAALWQVGNRAGLWRGCAAYFTPAGRVTLCAARPVERTWAAILEQANGRKP